MTPSSPSTLRYSRAVKVSDEEGQGSSSGVCPHQ